MSNSAHTPAIFLSQFYLFSQPATQPQQFSINSTRHRISSKTTTKPTTRKKAMKNQTETESGNSTPIRFSLPHSHNHHHPPPQAYPIHSQFHLTPNPAFPTTAAAPPPPSTVSFVCGGHDGDASSLPYIFKDIATIRRRRTCNRLPSTLLISNKSPRFPFCLLLAPLSPFLRMDSHVRS